MAGRVTVLTPVNNSSAIELGRSTWRKQILPIGQLDYSGRKLNFTREYLNNLVTAFKDRAFDACPLQLADASNSHTNEPDRAAGEIVGLEATDDGLFATVTATDKGSEILRDHPNLGVSVRIVEDYQRQTGQGSKAYPAALQHVLCTWAPRIASMKPWEPITCSEEADDVIDLSALVFTADGSAVAPNSSASSPGDGKTDVPPQEASRTMAPQVTEEELAAIRSVVSLLPTLQKLVAPPEGEASTETKVEPPAATVTPIVKVEAPAAEADEDAEVEQAIAAATGDDEGKVIDLAVVELRTIADRQAIELAEIKAERDHDKWKLEAHELTSSYGIFPAVVNLAEPLLKGAKHVVELSDGKTVDAGQVMRSVLHSVAKLYGKGIDLSGPIGSAHEADGTEDEAAAARKRIHDDARARGFGK